MTGSRASRIAATGLLLLLLWLVVYPLVLVLIEGLRQPTGWTLAYVRLFFQDNKWQDAIPVLQALSLGMAFRVVASADRERSATAIGGGGVSTAGSAARLKTIDGTRSPVRPPGQAVVRCSSQK